MSTGDLYSDAMGATSAYLAAVRPEQWFDPTPGSEWNGKDIANHVIGENLCAAELLQGKTIEQLGNRLEGDLTGGDPAAAYATSVRAARSACRAQGALEAVCHLSFGEYTGAEYAGQLLLDTLVHGWDIAKATGQDTQLDPELVAACLPIAEQLTTQFRSAGVFCENLSLPLMRPHKRSCWP